MPTPTDAERTRARFKTGDDDTSLPNDIIDLLFEEAEEEYPGKTRKVIIQAVNVLRRENLLMQACKNVTYRQNEATENLSDIAKGMAADLEKERAKLDEMVKDEDGPIGYVGAIRKVPTRRREEP